MEPPIKKPNISKEIKDDSNLAQPLSANNVLTNEDVLKIVFSYLSAYDLSQVSKICRIWREAAKNEILYRRAPEYILKNFQIIGADGSSSYDAKLLGKELKIQPELALIFQKLNEDYKWKVSGCYGLNLPSKCKTIIIGGFDIIANGEEISDDLGNAVGVFLPKFVPQVHQVYLNQEDKKRRGINLFEYLQLDYLLPDPKEHTCIIVLTDRKGYEFTSTVMERIRERYKPGTLSLWGGICYNLKLCDQAKNRNGACGDPLKFIMIKFQDPKIKSWSIVLSSKCRKDTQIKEKLENFKKTIELKNYSLGLMFACCERSSTKDLEVEIFKKVFSKTPLVGMSGYGEIGVNTLSEKKREQLQHEFTTVFLILTYDLSHKEAKMMKQVYGEETHWEGV